MALEGSHEEHIIVNGTLLSGIQNVSNAGVPIPIIYGLVFTGSIIISSGVDTAQVKKSLS